MSQRQDASRRATTRRLSPYAMVRTNLPKRTEDKQARTSPSHCTVYTFDCKAMLIMQSESSLLPVAPNVPSGEIAHEYTCNTISIRSAAAAAHPSEAAYRPRVRLNSRLFLQLFRHGTSTLFSSFTSKRSPRKKLCGSAARQTLE